MLLPEDEYHMENEHYTKMKFSIKDFFIFCAVKDEDNETGNDARMKMMK